MTWQDLVTYDSWVTADQHWEHPRIREYQHRPADHFEIMRERWIESVAEDDVLLHLGDIVCFGDRAQHPHWVEGLPGRKLLIRGNHDQHSDEWYEAAGFEVVGRGNKPFIWRDGIAFSHEPITQDRFMYGRDDHNGLWEINVHGHTHANAPWDQLPDKLYVNACVEVTDYAPIRLRELVARDES